MTNGRKYAPYKDYWGGLALANNESPGGEGKKGRTVGLYCTDTLQETPENRSYSFPDQISQYIAFQVTSSILNIVKYLLLSLHVDQVLMGWHQLGCVPVTRRYQSISVMAQSSWGKKQEAQTRTTVADLWECMAFSDIVLLAGIFSRIHFSYVMHP